MKRHPFKKTFRVPEIFGALLPEGKKAPREVIAAFRYQKHSRAFLSFETKKKHLKNIAECMKAMDIVGLFVSPDFSKEIARFISPVGMARSCKAIDVIFKRKDIVRGRCVKAETLAALLLALNVPKKFRTIKVEGLGLDTRIAVCAGKAAGFRVKKTGEATIVVRTKGGIAIASGGKTSLSASEFARIYYRNSVEFLTT